MVYMLPTVIKKRHLKGEKPLPVIKRKRAGQPEGFKEFGRLQNDTKSDELMMEDLGKYVIKNITGRTYWKSCSVQEGMRYRKRHDGLLFNYHLCKWVWAAKGPGFGWWGPSEQFGFNWIRVADDRFTKVIVNRKSKITLTISSRACICAFH